jgi:hypothetical protein
MKRNAIVFGISVAMILAAGVVASSQGRGASKPAHSAKPLQITKSGQTVKASKPVQPSKQVKPAKTTTTIKSKGTKPATPTKAAKSVKAEKATKIAAKKTKAETKAAAKTAKTDTKAAAKIAKTEAKATAKTTKTEAKAVARETEKDAKSTTAVSPAPTTTPTGELTAVQQKLQKNTNLAAKVASRLPLGTDVIAAAAGFKNLGQFVAAANVSHNLGLSFTELKTKMVTDGMSLGQAIQSVRPATTATIEAQRAEYDARGMIAQSEQESAVTATTTPTRTAVKTKVNPKKSSSGS